MPILPSIGRDVSRVLGVDSDAARRLLLGKSGQRKREQGLKAEDQARVRADELFNTGRFPTYEEALKQAQDELGLFPTVEDVRGPGRVEDGEYVFSPIARGLGKGISGRPPGLGEFGAEAGEEEEPGTGFQVGPGAGQEVQELEEQGIPPGGNPAMFSEEWLAALASQKGASPSGLPEEGSPDKPADTFIDNSAVDAIVADEEEEPTGRIALPLKPEVGGRPDTVARILEVLGGIGAGIGKSRSIGKANKLTAQRQALSNLVNTLRGSATAGVAREEPRAGLLQTLGAGLGLGAKSFREGREEGREERNVAAQKEFENLIERQKGEAGALKALAGAQGKPGLTAAEVRLYETFGENIVTGDPFSSFDPSLARQQILANNPGILETDMVAALSAVRAAATDRQREERKIVQDALADVFKEKGEVAPSQLVSQWETIVFTNGIYVPVEETERVIKAIEATAAITPLSDGNRTKLSNLFALRSGISRILGRLQDPAFDKHLSLLGSRKNALLGGISPRLYPPEVRQAMTELGFTSELLLRTFTGAAAPQTEFERFGQLFVGTLTDGRQALVSQLTGLDNGLQDQVNEIFVAAREGRGYKEPDKQDGDQAGEAGEDISQEVLEALGKLVKDA